MRPIAKAHGVSVARVALAWLLAQKHVTSVIIGAKSPDQLKDNIGATELTLTASGELDKADKPAIAEIIASAKDKKIYRVKLHDKTPALALLTRILEKFVKQDEQTDDDGEEARQFLLEELDRLAAEVVAEEGDREVAAGDPVAG